MKYFIKTFGCQQNWADSERIARQLHRRAMRPAKELSDADYVVINTCMIRKSAENRAYGLVNNLSQVKQRRPLKIILTGCLVGLAYKDKSGRYLRRLRTILPAVDEFLPIEEVGFDWAPLRTDAVHAWVPISQGCNNFCTYCVVPFTRGREISRPFEQIVAECRQLIAAGYQKVTLLGQNVNSYGSDLVGQKTNQTNRTEALIRARHLKPVYVKHLGRLRIPTLFPFLLDEVARMGFAEVNFLSSNPWDFSDELIAVIARHPNIGRTIHLPLQSGDDRMLKKMNRWYTTKQYLRLVAKLKRQIPGLKLTTDIIVGFCGETEAQFNQTVSVCKTVGFAKAYVSMYSPRPATAAQRVMPDDIPHPVKKRRWQILEDLINQPQLKKRKKTSNQDGSAIISL
ncbi:MAG: MiaB/RimO family radical SAM methylthiotransferase [Patescibacteria group bacterium]|nr:MiaB/RimO family radical SAM methylthiotransferase [Patescibacteria group bacterium]